MNEKRFERQLGESWPLVDWSNLTVVLAVSGGADSVALLRAMAAMLSAALEAGAMGPHRRLVVAHLNHALRGSESDADQAFVESICQQLGVDCQVGQGDVEALAQRQGDGLESAAREARYEFLLEVAHRVGARFVATAHTADDQAETILHRILRGTGIAGLAGISRTRRLSDAVTLIRPMLGFRRSDVLDYLQSLGQPFREDASNRELRFTRNRIRHDLLPKLADEYNSNVVDALLRLGHLAGESQAAMGLLAQGLMDEAVTDRSSREVGESVVVIDRELLSHQPRGMIREVLRLVWRENAWPEQAMGFEQWEMLAAMVSDDPNGEPVRVFPGEVRAEKKGGQLWLTRPLG